VENLLPIAPNNGTVLLIEPYPFIRYGGKQARTSVGNVLHGANPSGGIQGQTTLPLWGAPVKNPSDRNKRTPAGGACRYARIEDTSGKTRLCLSIGRSGCSGYSVTMGRN